MGQSRREFLKFLGTAALVGSAGRSTSWAEPAGSTSQDSAARRADRPNIIFILADDFGITGVSSYGGSYRTEQLDALARGGIRFEYCFSMPLCAPSRAACLTGRYGFRTGVVDNGTGRLATPDRETTIAKVLQQAGYATAMVGKWHQLPYLSTAEQAKSWGFDEFLVWERATGERYWKPAYNKNGQTLQVTEKDYGPDLLQEFAVDFIKRHQNKRFFLYYPMVLVHGPIPRTPDSAPDSHDLFADNIRYMDKLVGKLVAELEGLKLRERTVIVFTGDNGCVRGGTLNGRSLDGSKGTMKEGGSRVPLIVNWPGTTAAGQICTDLIDFSDFFPTLAQLAGVSVPPGITLDGRSFTPQIKGQQPQSRSWVFVQLGDRWYVRDQHWKLYNDGGLFNMSNAPFEEIPVSADKQTDQSRETRKRLQGVLDGLGIRTLSSAPPAKDNNRTTKRGRTRSRN